MALTRSRSWVLDTWCLMFTLTSGINIDHQLPSKWMRFQLYVSSFFPDVCEEILTIFVQLVVTRYIVCYRGGGSPCISPPSTDPIPGELGDDQSWQET